MAAVVFTVTDTSGPPFPIIGNGQSVAASFTGGQGSVGGPLRAVVKDLLCDGGTATAGGDALTAATLGLNSVVYLKADAIGAGFVHSYDYTNSKLQTWQSAGANGALDEANTIAISHHVRVFALGT